jgi:hypothetical protein
LFSILVLAIATLGGCSSKPPAGAAKKSEIPLRKIQGKVRVNPPDQTAGGDRVLNADGDSLYLWEGKRLYRLFSRKGLTLKDGAEYVVEGIVAQTAIDEIGDPAQGKQGYPLLSSCERVVKMAWSGMSFEEVDMKAGMLRARAGRYPARKILLVVRIQPVPGKDGGKKAADSEDEDADLPSAAVAADKQKASLLEGSVVQPAPLWDSAGAKVPCKVIIGTDGKIAKLETGAQLCEAFDWDKLRYEPLVKGGKPVRVKTEVELTYEPRK